MDPGIDTEPVQSSDADSDADSAASELDSDAEDDQTPQPAAGQKTKANSDTAAVAAQPQDDEQAELQQFENAQERREEMKQQLAVTASKILQNPEAHLPSLKSVLALAADKDTQVHFISPFTPAVLCSVHVDLGWSTCVAEQVTLLLRCWSKSVICG